MPVVLRYRGYRLYFYSDEGMPREPVHIHARKGSDEVKFWLRPFVTVARNWNVSQRDQDALAAFVLEHREELERAWNEFFLA